MHSAAYYFFNSNLLRLVNEGTAFSFTITSFLESVSMLPSWIHFVPTHATHFHELIVNAFSTWHCPQEECRDFIRNACLKLRTNHGGRELVLCDIPEHDGQYIAHTLALGISEGLYSKKCFCYFLEDVSLKSMRVELPVRLQTEYFPLRGSSLSPRTLHCFPYLLIPTFLSRKDAVVFW